MRIAHLTTDHLTPFWKIFALEGYSVGVAGCPLRADRGRADGDRDQRVGQPRLAAGAADRVPCVADRVGDGPGWGPPVRRRPRRRGGTRGTPGPPPARRGLRGWRPSPGRAGRPAPRRDGARPPARGLPRDPQELAHHVAHGRSGAPGARRGAARRERPRGDLPGGGPADRTARGGGGPGGRVPRVLAPRHARQARGAHDPRSPAARARPRCRPRPGHAVVAGARPPRVLAGKRLAPAPVKRSVPPPRAPLAHASGRAPELRPRLRLVADRRLPDAERPARLDPAQPRRP